MKEELPQLLKRSLEVVNERNDHALPPILRANIYGRLGHLDDGSGRTRRCILGINTAKGISGIWQREMPNDKRIEEFIALALEVLKAPMTLTDLGLRLDHERDCLYEAKGRERLAERLLYTLEAAIEVVWLCAGFDRFAGISLTPDMTDADLDPWTSDVPLYAASAYAGPLWTPRSSSTKRLDFWNWWLQQAVPSAWNMEYTEPLVPLSPDHV